MKPRGGAVSAHVPLLPAPVGKAGQGDVIETTSAAGNVPPLFRREQKSDGAVTGAAQIGAGLREEQKKTLLSQLCRCDKKQRSCSSCASQRSKRLRWR